MSTQIPQDQYVMVGDINTRFRTAGAEGTTVVLLHGIGDAVETWDDNINVLAEHHRVYALDMVGFGRSDKPPIQPSLAFGVQFVSDFMENQHIERTSLIGNSMGGAISLQFAIQFPEKLDKLVIENSAALGKGVAGFFRLFSIPLIGELFSRPSHWGTAWILKQIAYVSTLITDNLVELYYQLATLPGAQRWLLSTLRVGMSLLGQRAQFVRFIVDNLSKISCPTLIIWGEQDRIIPVAHAQVAKKRILNAELQILDPCGHMPHFEHPEDFNQLILEFLNR